ncbi:putative bifunctional diguanylate cyclase/phosphodiesterase [Neptuniibacter marinus]|uniref:putative bifunctional diguanylate cyclase/phosphodiesterase n=1 Tax=Neptuniibacter marinus TaxID=1806670 RepID=UPI000832D7C8|nr:bifunctional diguanylate cyclase/phosphodiesterase [Neptuniibacter marinus]
MSKLLLSKNNIKMLIDWFSQSSIGILLLDHSLQPVASNPYALELIWGSAQTAESKSELPQLFKQKIKAHLDHLKNTDIQHHSDYQLIEQPNSSSILLKIECSLVEIDQTEQGFFITLRNASKNAHLARELKLFRNAVENTGSAVVITNAQGEIEYANTRFSDITGYSFPEIQGKKTSILRSDTTSKGAHDNLWETISRHKKWHGTLLNKRKDGTTYWSLQNISPIHDELGNITNFVSVSEDISKIKEHDQQLEKMAYFDPLTNLGNRRNFRRTLDQYLQSPTNEGAHALLLLDLDHFKQINDTMGHEAGDALLNTIANRLCYCVPDQASVFRLGGDEFTIIFHALNDPDLIIHNVNEILRLLSQPVQIGFHDVRITVSIGITLIGADSQDPSDLLRNADLAMYHAKQLGRNTFAFYEAYMDEKAQRILSIEHDLRNALTGKQLSLAYQPQVNGKDGRISAIEALLRWEHPTKGAIPPDEFIPHAEETGAIIPIGRWVLLEACKAAQQLQDEGLPPLKVCVNLSARQFDDPDLIEHIEEAISKSGLASEWLELEITESMLMRDMQHAIETLKKIKMMGIGLAIDDFGTGYSSLSHLKKMPVDLLKVDRSFLQDIPADKDNIAITSTIIAMAKQLGLSVVAEGVETKEQMLFLQKIDCMMMQGFLFSRPISFEAFKTLYQTCQFHCGVCKEYEICALKQDAEKGASFLN